MKKFLIIALASVMVCAALSGCAKTTRGNQNLSGVSVAEIQERIKEGVTTKAQIKEWLGDPEHITKDRKNKEETWVYTYYDFEAQQRITSYIPYVSLFLGGTDTREEMRELSITFNPKGIVEIYSFGTADH